MSVSTMRTGSFTPLPFWTVRAKRNPRCWKKCRRKANLAKRDASSPVDTHDPPCGERLESTNTVRRQHRSTQMLSHFFILWPPQLEKFPPKHQALCYSLFLQKQTQDISLLRIFQLSNIVHHPYQSVPVSYTHLTLPTT